MTAATQASNGLPLPNLIIAGVTKAGTTSLFHYLGQHRSICLSDVKATDHYTPIVYGERPAGSLEQYARHFEAWAGERWRLEASAAYFSGGTPLIEALRTDLPEARVLIILRDPVARLWSGYTYKRSKGRLPRGMDFDRFFATCLRSVDGGGAPVADDSLYRTLSTGRYADHLEPWIRALGHDLRLVYFEDLAADPAATVGQICSWLGLDSDMSALDFSARNKTLQPRSVTLRRVAYSVNRRLTPILGQHPAIERAAKSAYVQINAAGLEEEFSPEAQAKVRAFYEAPGNRLAAALTKRAIEPLPSWLAGANAD